MSHPDRLVPARFVVLAEASPGLLSRLLQPLAKRDLVPDRMEARREGEAMRVEILLDAMPAGMVPLVAGNIGQVFGVIDLQAGAPAAARVSRATAGPANAASSQAGWSTAGPARDAQPEPSVALAS